MKGEGGEGRVGVTHSLVSVSFSLQRHHDHHHTCSLTPLLSHSRPLPSPPHCLPRTPHTRNSLEMEREVLEGLTRASGRSYLGWSCRRRRRCRHTTTTTRPASLATRYSLLFFYFPHVTPPVPVKGSMSGGGGTSHIGWEGKVITTRLWGNGELELV